MVMVFLHSCKQLKHIETDSVTQMERPARKLWENIISNIREREIMGTQLIFCMSTA